LAVQTYKKEFKDIWLKAAVLGSLWGSIEIIIGSFFHNIRFPMAGTILAVLGVSMLAAFGQIWKDKGLFWRAGLISAVMKSVSPSAILIGPMTGIFFEALLFEIAVRLFGRNYFGFIIGGMIALYSVIVHKVTSLLIIYGFDLVKILDNLYSFIIKQLQIKDLSFLQAFLLISSVYLLLGFTASIIGILIGRRAKSNRILNDTEEQIDFIEKNDFFSTDESKGGLVMLVIHFFFIVFILAVSNLISFQIASVLILLYILFVLFKYKRSVRFLKRPWFWLQIILFIIISAIFYNGFSKHNLFTDEGLIAGLKMGARALIIVLGFSAISTEMRNPFIRIFLYKKGFSQFYTATGLAFSVLPYIIKRSANAKSILRNPIKNLSASIHDAEHILTEFKKIKFDSEVFIITGEKHQGKSTFAEKLVKLLQKEGKTVKGFIAPGKFIENHRSEFSIQDVFTGESKMLCSIKGTKEQKQVGKFYFSDEGLLFGKDLLKTENVNDADFIIIDELGPFELRGKGWSSSIDALLKNPDFSMIWVVRRSLVYDIIRRFGVNCAVIIDIQDNSVESVRDLLIKKSPQKAGKR
jgi:nucleoside-triphosphatase THEP1